MINVEKYYILTVNQRVLGSSPRGSAKQKKELQYCNSFLFTITPQFIFSAYSRQSTGKFWRN